MLEELLSSVARLPGLATHSLFALCVVLVVCISEEHRGKPFFAGLANFFASGPIVAMVGYAAHKHDPARYGTVERNPGLIETIAQNAIALVLLALLRCGSCSRRVIRSDHWCAVWCGLVCACV